MHLVHARTVSLTNKLKRHMYRANRLISSVADCELPEKMSNGTVHIKDGSTMIGSVASYQCMEGHLLLGSPMRQCIVGNGKLEWIPETPKCVSRGNKMCSGRLLHAALGVFVFKQFVVCCASGYISDLGLTISTITLAAMCYLVFIVF